MAKTKTITVGDGERQPHAHVVNVLVRLTPEGMPRPGKESSGSSSLRLESSVDCQCYEKATPELAENAQGLL
jgi:hypothetical protein